MKFKRGATKRRLAAGAVLLLLLLNFQNCGQVSSFHEIDGNNLNADSLPGGNSPTPTPTPGGNPTPTPTPGMSPTPTPSATPTPQPTATPTPSPTPTCNQSQVGQPSMQNSPTSVAQVLSGKGMTEGSYPSSNLNFSYTASNAPQGCSQNANVQCNIVSSNVTAYDQTGTANPVPNNDLVCTRNPTTVAPGNAFTVAFSASDNDTTLQCFSGTVVFAVALQSQANTKEMSTPQNITVTYKNNCFPEQFVNDAPNAYDQFGTAVAMDGDTAAVVAPGDDGINGTTPNVGAVYIYNRVGPGNVWSLVQTVRTTDTSNVALQGASNDNPAAIALKNGVLVLGSEFNNSNNGAVYVFTKTGSTWAAVQKLSGAVPGGRFGKAVALDSTHLVIGAPGENSQAGSVYIYNVSNFAKTAQITSPLAANDYFGAAVAVENNLLAVGAPGAPLYENQTTGDLVMYQYGTSWTEITANPLRSNKTKQNVTITDQNGKSGSINFAMASELGTAVAINNGITVVGSPGFTMGSTSPGLALVLSSNQSALQTMVDLSNTTGGLYGNSVSISGNNILVGAPKVRTNAGATDLYTLGGSVFGFSRRVTSMTGAANDQFGFAAFISDSYFLVGAKLKASPLNSEGAASFFSLP